MSTERDFEKVAALCKAKLDLAHVQLPEEYHYHSLPLCVIDAVFSIGVQYASTRNTVIRFCQHFGIPRLRKEGIPPPMEQLSMTDFIGIYDEYGIARMTEEVFRNRQRTSTRNGILKSEAVLRFSQVLVQFGIDYLQDTDRIIGNREFEERIQAIPGQRSGISLRYFYMLAGSDAYIKPDRMIARFIYSALNKRMSVDESHEVIMGAYRILVQEFPSLTPRALDYMIWRYQREL